MATRPIREHIQRHSLGKEIELFVIDMTLYDLGVKRLVMGDEGAAAAQQVVFDGEVYEPWPIRASGWAVSADGVMPRPTFDIANVNGIFTPLVSNNNDLKGCTITRIRTYDRYIDTGADPDPSQILPLDIYQISRMTKFTNTSISWQLASLLDQQDVILPGRQIMRDYCSHTYRKYVSGVGVSAVFDYTGVSCPYVGTDYFDKTDTSCAAAEDACGRRVGSCRDRFGANAELPTRAFPGVARIRRS